MMMTAKNITEIKVYWNDLMSRTEQEVIWDTGFEVSACDQSEVDEQAVVDVAFENGIVIDYGDVVMESCGECFFWCKDI